MFNILTLNELAIISVLSVLPSFINIISPTGLDCCFKLERSKGKLISSFLAGIIIEIFFEL